MNNGELCVLFQVRHVQTLLEQRRQRRSARRQAQRPYPASSGSHQTSATCPHTPASALASAPPPPFHPAEPHATQPDNVEMETTNYRKPSMEQETVAV